MANCSQFVRRPTFNPAKHHEKQRHPPEFSRFLRVQRPRHCGIQFTGSRQRSDVVVHQRRHGAVQGCIHRPGHARLHPRGVVAALRACRRQAQRPGKCRLHRAPPYVFRNAGQLQLRRLFQAGRDQIRVGIPHYGTESADREALGHGVCRRRRSVRYLAQRHRRAEGTHRPHWRQQGCALRLGQLLGNGRHRPLWPLHRDLLRPRRRHLRRPARLTGRRRRPLHRNLEQRVHAVQPR